MDDINIAEQLESEYVVFHPGSGSFSKIRDSLLRLAENIPQNVKVLIENTASNKNRVCSGFTSLKNLIDGINIGLCLDTCHAFVAGYNLYHAPTKIINALDKIICLNNIPIFHFNDAIGDFDSGLDRHASLLEGKIGNNLKYVFQDQRLKDKIFIVECPKEKYLYNLSVLKNWINS